MRGFRGYICSGEVDSQVIPQRVQNLVIRDYAERKNLRFLLSAVEYGIEGSSMMLRSILAEDDCNGFIFYSYHLLPDEFNEREHFYNLLLQQKRECHFALEEISVQSLEDAKRLEELIAIGGIARKFDSMPI